MLQIWTRVKTIGPSTTLLLEPLDLDFKFSRHNIDHQSSWYVEELVLCVLVSKVVAGRGNRMGKSKCRQS